MPATATNQDLLKIALKASEMAEENVLKYFQRDLSIEWKADRTPVTLADKSTEELLREFWLKETPDFGVLGEEFGDGLSDKEYRWIVDPIDGTKSFIRGVPLFGTIIALYRKNVPVASVIRIPALHSAVWAVQDGGAFLDGNPVRCSRVHSLADALVLSGTVNTMETEGYGEGFAKLRRSANLYRGWGDCYGYYLVASGRAEVMVDPVVSLWDIAAYPLLFQEAGGKFTTIEGESNLFDEAGRPVACVHEGYTSIASNGILHEPARTLLNGLSCRA